MAKLVPAPLRVFCVVASNRKNLHDRSETTGFSLRAGLLATARSRSAAAPVVRSEAPCRGPALHRRLAAPTSVQATPSPATWTCVSDRYRSTARASQGVSSHQYFSHTISSKISTSIYPFIWLGSFNEAGNTFSAAFVFLANKQFHDLIRTTPVTKRNFSILESPEIVLKTLAFKKKIWTGHRSVLIAPF